jgi:adenosylhomocysteine nucleosidase
VGRQVTTRSLEESTVVSSESSSRLIRVALLMGLLTVWLAAPSASAVEHGPKVAIGTAFGPEFDALAPLIEQPVRRQHNGVTFVSGSLEGVEVVLFKTGVSIVNAAMTTQLALTLFEIDEIVVSGIAGAVDPALNIGDVAVPARWGKYDEMVFLRDAEDPLQALPPGLIPQFPPYDAFMATRGVRIASAQSPAPTPRFWYPADPALLAVARTAAADVALNGCYRSGAEDACLEPAPRVRVGGAGVSGSIFLDNADFRRFLDDTFDADVVEMETAAVAMVAHANGVPFIAFRSVSDLAGGEGSPNEMRLFMRFAATNAALLVRAYLAERSARP